MAGAIAVKRVEKGRYQILKHGQHVADLMRTQQDDDWHSPGEPWLLESTSGRRDRFETKGDAVDEAHKF